MSTFRTIAERLARGRTVWRTLPAPFSAARVLVTPDAALSYLRPGKNWCDPQLLRVVDTYVEPGSAVWDIGANVGVFGVAAAVRCGTAGQVICVEPDPVLSQLVRKSAARLPAGSSTIDVLAAAIAETPGVAEFLIAKRGRASNALASFGRGLMGGARERQLVPIVQMDTLLKTVRPPTLIKIDIEGAEASALAGAKIVLNEIRPTVYVEVGDENKAAVTRFFKEASYLLFDPDKAVAGQAPLSECIWNTLAIPSERAQ